MDAREAGGAKMWNYMWYPNRATRSDIVNYSRAAEYERG